MIRNRFLLFVVIQICVIGLTYMYIAIDKTGDFIYSNFGLFPEGFSDDVTVWDIGFWKEEILNYDFRENDSQGLIDLIYNWSENIASNEECLIFSFLYIYI